MTVIRPLVFAMAFSPLLMVSFSSVLFVTFLFVMKLKPKTIKRQRRLRAFCSVTVAGPGW